MNKRRGGGGEKNRYRTWIRGRKVSRRKGRRIKEFLLALSDTEKLLFRDLTINLFSLNTHTKRDKMQTRAKSC